MKFKIKESQLRQIINESVNRVLNEKFDNIEGAEEIETDEWNKPDEFTAPEEEPVEISDDEFILEPQEKPEDKKKTDLKRERVAALFRNILAKQGLSGEKLEREVEKRLGRATTKTDAATRRQDRAFDNDPVNINGQQSYLPSGGIYDDDPDLYESVKKIVEKALREVL